MLDSQGKHYLRLSERGLPAEGRLWPECARRSDQCAVHGARLLLIDSMLTAAVLVATTAAKPQLAQLLSRATDLETSAGDTTSGIHGPFPLSTDGWRA